MLSLIEEISKEAEQQIDKHGQHGGFTCPLDWINSLSNVELLERIDEFLVRKSAIEN